jgi:hypothetical protein
MLNIFLGRKPLPEYKLTKPAQLQEIIVKEDVGFLKDSIEAHVPNEPLDHQDQTLRVRCHSPRCQVRQGSL